MRVSGLVVLVLCHSALAAEVPAAPCSSWEIVPSRNGWFDFPDGWALKATSEGPWAGWRLRHAGDETGFDDVELKPRQRGAWTESVRQVRVCGSQIELLLKVTPWFVGDVDHERIVVSAARLHARFHQAFGDRGIASRNTGMALMGYRAALAEDPTLSIAYAGFAEALLASGNRDGAVAAIVAGMRTDLPAVYFHVLARRRLWEVLEAPAIVALRGPADGDATLRERGLSWSPRLQSAAHFRQNDSGAAIDYGELMVTSLESDDDARLVAPRGDDPNTRKIVDRYLRDLGFRKGRSVPLPSCVDETDRSSERVDCWAHALQKLDVPGLEVREDVQVDGAREVRLVADGKNVLRRLSHEKYEAYGTIWHIGWLPEARVLWIEGMHPPAPDGAPCERSFIERHRL